MNTPEEEKKGHLEVLRHIRDLLQNSPAAVAVPTAPAAESAPRFPTRQDPFTN